MRAGPRNKPTQREREEHEATHVPFRDWCVHCMMGRGRTHHHIEKQKSVDQSRRPTIALDYFFIWMESAPNVHAISEESMTCVTVKEDRHQNIMSSVALKKGVKEPWTTMRVVRLIDLLGYREITLKSDTDCNCRVHESCSCIVQSRSYDGGRGEGRQRIKWTHGEYDNVVAWNHSNCQVPHQEQDAGPLDDVSLVMPWLVEHAGCILFSGVKKVMTVCQETDTGIRPVWRKNAGKTNHHRSDEQDEPQM